MSRVQPQSGDSVALDTDKSRRRIGWHEFNGLMRAGCARKLGKGVMSNLRGGIVSVVLSITTACASPMAFPAGSLGEYELAIRQYRVGCTPEGSLLDDTCLRHSNTIVQWLRFANSCSSSGRGTQPCANRIGVVQGVIDIFEVSDNSTISYGDSQNYYRFDYALFCELVAGAPEVWGEYLSSNSNPFEARRFYFDQRYRWVVGYGEQSRQPLNFSVAYQRCNAWLNENVVVG